MSKRKHLPCSTQSIETVKKAILAEYSKGLKWRQVAGKYGITGGMAYRIAHGYEPREAHIRHLLNLPALVYAPVCPTCGEIHLRRTCPKTTKPRARRAISLTDPESAAATILSKADGDYVDRLIEFLQIRRYYD